MQFLSTIPAYYEVAGVLYNDQNGTLFQSTVRQDLVKPSKLNSQVFAHAVWQILAILLQEKKPPNISYN